MNSKKLLLAGLSCTLLIGAAATASFAAPGGPPPGHGHPHRPRVQPEVLYIRMLKEFDANGDMKITKEEVSVGIDKIFDEVDTNKDGEITPGELRAYHDTRVQAWRDAHKKTDDAKADDTQSQDRAQNSDQGDRKGGGPRGHWMQPARVMRAAMIFHRVDKDESGQISKQEAEDAANRMFDRLDRNKDGVITLDDMPDRPFL
ncbi:EF-hand domain-containing protein [Rhizobium sp. RAF56]|uniref:EF-hand domain-containing protein n=1 Tax=Rhizobium sp. RAF56 TaxID=3233062 RepID=UPI003F97A01C